MISYYLSEYKASYQYVCTLYVHCIIAKTRVSNPLNFCGGLMTKGAPEFLFLAPPHP